MRKVKVISAAGQKRTGKDTLADYLAPRLTRKIPIPCHGGGVFEDAPWGRGSFATAVKKIYCETFKKDLAFIEEWKVKDECPPGMTQTVRQALTFIGDGFRRIQPDIWIETAFRPENDPYYRIFSDVRYINEARKIKQEGGVNILLYRENGENWDEDGSEREILPYVLWCVITKREGKITDFPEFKEKQIWSRSDTSDSDLISLFWDSLPYTNVDLRPSRFRDQFFDNLSQFDLFIRCEDGPQNVYDKANTIVLPYIRSISDNAFGD